MLGVGSTGRLTLCQPSVGPGVVCCASCDLCGCVCACVCMRACVRACVRAYVRVRAYMRVRMRVRLCVHTCVCLSCFRSRIKRERENFSLPSYLLLSFIYFPPHPLLVFPPNSSSPPLPSPHSPCAILPSSLHFPPLSRRRWSRIPWNS